MSRAPKGMVMILWPESQRIMEHPEAFLVLDRDSCTYVVPIEVWEKYRFTYYEECENCGGEIKNRDYQGCKGCEEE